MGLKNVRTYIQIGNVVFQCKSKKTQEIAHDIGTAIGNSHGFTPQVFVLSVQDLRDAIVSNPFPEGESDPKSLHLSFLDSSPANPDLKRLELLKTGAERFKLIGTVFYLHAPNGIGRSKLAANVEKSLGVTLTGRNWRSANTILSMAMELGA